MMTRPKDSYGVEVGDWKIETRRSTISNTPEIDRMTAELGIPMPTMIFGDNHLAIKHKNGFSLEFKAEDALKLVEKKIVRTLKISEDWIRSRLDQKDKMKITLPFDWTYTTAYAGTLSEGFEYKSTEKQIDYALLSRMEPILFFDDVILFEDELADNGLARLSVKVRVMNSSIFALQRFFLRIEGELFRVYDTRIFHNFDTDYVLRETTIKESSYGQVKQQTNDLQKLMDADWIASVLEMKEKRVEEVLTK